MNTNQDIHIEAINTSQHTSHTHTPHTHTHTPITMTLRKHDFKKNPKKEICVQISGGSPNHATHNAQYLSHFAAAFIVVRTKTSILKPSTHTPTHTQSMTLREHNFKNNPKEQHAFKFLVVHRIMQLTMLVTLRCCLHHKKTF